MTQDTDAWLVAKAPITPRAMATCGSVPPVAK
jgi:hypothetical protein